MVKRLLGVLSVLMLCIFINAQVTTEPAFITKGYKGEIVVIFDPAAGNAGMADATACYAHTGLITSKSKDGGDWKYANEKWRGGEDKYKMTKDGNVWKLTIANIYEYYGCPESEEILKMAFVFNDGPDGEKEGKTADGTDIYVELVDGGLNVKFDNPTSNQLIDKGTKITFKITASEKSNISLIINNKEISSAENTELTYDYTFTETGDFVCVAKATLNNQTVTDSVNLCVTPSPKNEARPSGLKDGITYYENDPTKVTLCLYYKDNNNKIAQNAFVLGDFNNWSYSTTYQMKKDGETGYFWLDITGLEAGKEYVFQYAIKRPNGAMIQVSDAFTHKVVDPNDHYIPEDIYPNKTAYPQEADGPCAVIETGRKPYAWSDATLNFKRPDKNNLVIYELWVYDFCPTRSFEGVLDRLDYIENLGINAIEFMPVCEFEGNISWGYNPTHYFAVDKAYGTEDMFKKLVDECHKRGIAVIVDMVFNHATGWAPFNKMFGGYDNLKDNPYFNVSAPHDGNVFEDFNHEFDLTLNHFTRVLNYWLKEYKIDGYRMDLSHGFCGPNCNDQKRIMYHYFNEGVKAVDPNAYFILEHWDGNRTDYANNGMMCWENTGEPYQELAMGWYEGSKSDLHRANNDNYVSYAESHDEERCGYKASEYGNGAIKTDKATRLSYVPAYVAMSTMLNGPQMLWMFEELGYDVSIFFNPNNNEMKEEHRTEPKPIPEANGFYKDANRMAQYQKIGQINQLRTRILPKVFEGNPTSYDLGGGRPLRSVIWGNGVNRVFIVSNVSVSNQDIELPQGTTNWYDYLANNSNAMKAGTKVTMKPGEVKVYTAQYFQLPEVPTEYDFISNTNIENIEYNKPNCTIYPTITENVIYIESSEEINSVEVINVQGQKLISLGNVNSINVSSLPQGLYMVIVNFDDSQEAYKIYRK